MEETKKQIVKVVDLNKLGSGDKIEAKDVPIEDMGYQLVSSILSKLPDGKTINSPCITNHQKMIFIIAPKVAVPIEEKEVELTMESYVCLSYLDEELRNKVRMCLLGKKVEEKKEEKNE